MKLLKFSILILLFASCTKSNDSTPPTKCGEFVQLWYKKTKPTPDTMQRYYLTPEARQILQAQGEDGKVVIKNDTLTVIHRLLDGPCH